MAEREQSFSGKVLGAERWRLLTAVTATVRPGRMLWAYGLFGAAVAFAGPPIYIHTPNLYATQHGVSLEALGAILLGLRLLDFVQDPLLGWWIASTRWHRRKLAAGFAGMLGMGALLLFAPQPLLPAGIWLALSLALVFTAFSALQILYYGSGVALAAGLPGEHRQIAGWREAGVLVGISAACVAPALFGALFGQERAYFLYAIGFCILLGFAVVRMSPWWPVPAAPSGDGGWSGIAGFRQLLRDGHVRRLMLICLINALPTGLTATLFVFFVTYSLEASDHVGPALLLFFLAAAFAAPIWTRLAGAIGPKSAMLVGMTLAILSFLWVLMLGPGDWPAFYAISAISGASLGADMTLLPAMLSRRLADRRFSPDHAFGLWGFLNKASLALAAGTALPALAAAGFNPGGSTNGPDALFALTIAYAAIPCALKALAVFTLVLTPITEGNRT
jgi:GPH family glycoside/pentoside/hexuronide:cation symporter